MTTGHADWCGSHRGDEAGQDPCNCGLGTICCADPTPALHNRQPYCQSCDRLLVPGNAEQEAAALARPFQPDYTLADLHDEGCIGTDDCPDECRCECHAVPER